MIEDFAPRVRLVATDLDGTLLREDGTISARTVAAIRLVQRAGVVVVLVTARNWRSVIAIGEQAGVTGLAVCSNGAVVYDLARRQVHRAAATDSVSLRRFLAACEEVGGCCFGWETAIGAFRTPAYHELAQPDTGLVRRYLDAIEIRDHFDPEHEVTKLVVRHATLGIEELLGALLPYAKGVSLTVSGGRFVEVGPEGMSKATALAALCADLGIDASMVVAVGDHHNDLPMLQWAGRGVAMRNSQPSVLAAIPEHTDSNEEDGLALVLERLRC